MNITFLIGNGFDVNLGLKTKYTDFYDIYIRATEKYDANSSVGRFRNEIKENYENWSNFEWAFSQKASGTHHDVGEILSSFTDLFADYLQNECDKCSYSDNAVNRFKEFLLAPYKSLTRGDMQKMTSFYDQNKNSTHYYRFINFNYTDTLENLLKLVREKGISSRRLGGATYNDSVSEELHIHGSLKENYMIIGINALDQFLDDSLKTNKRLSRYCVKSTMNNEYGYADKESRFLNIINSSRIIYAYGLSFGETDRSRWEVLSNWLRSSKNNRLVIFKFNPGFDELDGMNKGLLLDAVDDARDEYLKLLGFEDNELENMHEQIYVADSSKVLGFKLVEDKKTLVTV